jgi:hypothetical protein
MYVNNRIHSIPLDKIKHTYNVDVTEAYLKRMKKVKDDLLDYDLLLAVEKDDNLDIYILVGGYDRYKFLLNCSGEKYAPCIIEKSSMSDKKRSLKVLQRLFNKGDTTKTNRQRVLNLLKQAQMRIESIIKSTGFTRSDILTNYQYNEYVPIKFINEHTTEKTMNWIESLTLTQQVKEFLYKRAGIPSGDKKRLTQDSVKIVKHFLTQEPRFQYLDASEQIKVLRNAISFKGHVVKFLKDMVDEFLNVTVK